MRYLYMLLKNAIIKYEFEKLLKKTGAEALEILKNPDINLQQIIEDNNSNSINIFYQPQLIHGFSYMDLSKEDFSNVSLKELLRIPFSNKTKWPKNLPAGFNPEALLQQAKAFKGAGIEEANRNGYTGKGVTVAYIDKCFDVNHKEFKDRHIEYIDQTSDHNLDFHGYAVASRLAGKNLGCAPDVNLIYYAAGNTNKVQDAKGKEAFIMGTVITGMDAIEDIINRVKNGENISAIGMSSSIDFQISLIKKEDEKSKLQARFEELKGKLKEINVPLIDASLSSKNFFYCHKIDPTLSNEIIDNWDCSDFVKQNRPDSLMLADANKCVPLPYTKKDYKYENACGCNSWTIPQVVGMFCLAKQANPDITYEEFVKLSKETALPTNKNGMRFANAYGLVVQAKNIRHRNSSRTK